MARILPLIDEARAMKLPVAFIHKSALAEGLRRGRVFRLDEEATEKLRSLVSQSSDLLPKMLEFAVPPYDVTIVEMSKDGRTGLTVLTPKRAWTIFRQPDTSITTLHYSLNVVTGQPEAEFEYTSDEEARRASEWWTFQTAMLAVFFLLLNKPGATTITRLDRKATLHKGRMMHYSACSVVTINLDGATKARRVLHDIIRVAPRAHEVRGTFVHLRVQKACIHDWQMVNAPEDKPKRWQCQHCAGLRVWRKAHIRGDSSKGFVSKSYKVTADQTIHPSPA